ncbi:MAG TPA: tetratricopeptide repeat protein [Polyangiaceae bacterium]|nr:tetratricopeptide repeat protein [Polyangiaceae bacterium]
MRLTALRLRRRSPPAFSYFLYLGALALVAAAIAPACKDSDPPAASSAAPGGSAIPTPAPTTPPTEDTPLGRARALALAKSGGSTPIDREIDLLQKRVEKIPKVTDTWILLGRAWVRKARESTDPGFYLNASACADIVLSMREDDRLALNLRSLVLLNEHKFADARDLAEQVLLKAPDDLMALATQSDALLELGRFDEASAAAQKMMDLKPNLPSFSRASYIRWLRGDIEGAKTAIRKAIDGRDPNEPEPGAWAIVQAAMIFWHLGDYGGADAGFDKALQLFSDYPPALAGKGRVALAKGDAARAVELLASSYQKSPLVETAWLLADAKEAAGDAKGAEEARARVVKTGRQTDPRTLAQFYATKGIETAEAIRLAEEELKVRGDIYTQDALAWALYRAGKFKEAREASDKAIALGTKDARLLYHAGAIRIALGDKEAGEKLVGEALKLNPKFDLTGSVEAEKLLAGEKKKAGSGG